MHPMKTHAALNFRIAAGITAVVSVVDIIMVLSGKRCCTF